MRRRAYLATVTALGTMASAGCSSDSDDPEDSPRYEDVTADEMVLSVDAFPDGWRRDDDFNDAFDASYRNADGTAVVLLSVIIEPTVDAAEQRLENSREDFPDPEDASVGDEGFEAVRNERAAFTMFRHSNALGESAAIREEAGVVEPDLTRSRNYAMEMYEHWQRL